MSVITSNCTGPHLLTTLPYTARPPLLPNADDTSGVSRRSNSFGLVALGGGFSSWFRICQPDTPLVL